MTTTGARETKQLGYGGVFSPFHSLCAGVYVYVGVSVCGCSVKCEAPSVKYRPASVEHNRPPRRGTEFFPLSLCRASQRHASKHKASTHLHNKAHQRRVGGDVAERPAVDTEPLLKVPVRQ